MASETISENLTAERKSSFWRRQFAGETTRDQIFFDILLGIALPIACFILDPGILTQGDLTGLSYENLHSQKLFIYLMSGVAILTLALWLLLGRRIKSWSGSFGGILLTGALCSFLIGLVILPLSIIGLALVIGALGFVPFLTSFVYLRNGIRAINRGQVYSSRALLVGTLVLSSAFVIAAPGVIQWRINNAVSQSMQEIINGEAALNGAAVRRLKYLRWFTDLDQIMWAYVRETDPSRKARLAAAYKE